MQDHPLSDWFIRLSNTMRQSIYSQQFSLYRTIYSSLPASPSMIFGQFNRRDSSLQTTPELVLLLRSVPIDPSCNICVLSDHLRFRDFVFVSGLQTVFPSSDSIDLTPHTRILTSLTPSLSLGPRSRVRGQSCPRNRTHPPSLVSPQTFGFTFLVRQK